MSTTDTANTPADGGQRSWGCRLHVVVGVEFPAVGAVAEAVCKP